MIIIINGMYRSGSTLSYNVVRRMLEIKGIGGAYGTEEARGVSGLLGRMVRDSNGVPISDTRGRGVTRMIELSHGKLWVVAKAHKLDATDVKGFGEDRAKAIMTYRHPADMAASLFRLFGKPYPKPGGLLQPLLEDIAMYFIQRKHPDVLTLKYEAYYNRVEVLAEVIAKFLNITLTADEVTQIGVDCGVAAARKHAEGRTRDETDPRTQIRGEHISDQGGAPGSYRHLVDKELQAVLRDCFLGFYKEVGYE